jgi:hypothetical protein
VTRAEISGHAAAPRGLLDSPAMRVIAGLVGLVCALAACGDDGFHRPPPGPDLPTIRVEPPDVTVTVVNGATIAKAYTATLVQPDGTESDISTQAQFSLRDARYGSFASAMLSITGQGAGPTRVIASFNGVTGDTGLTVYVKQTLVDPDVDPGTPGMFEGAADDPALAPQIAYPLDRILVPPNLGQFDVHWRATTADVFELQMSNQYLDIKRYTNGDDPNQPFWTVFQPAQWYPIASSREQLALKVTGMSSSMPGKKGTAPVQHVDVTNEDAQGGIYYWSTSGQPGIWRYDVGKPENPPTEYFPANMRPGNAGCMGCHSLSRDGTKLALTLDGAGGRGTVVDVANRGLLVPVEGTPMYWDFAVFDSAAAKLLAIQNGEMYLRGLDGAQIAGPLPSLSGSPATHPEFSPDNKKLANVEYTGGQDYYAYGGTIVVRSYDAAAGTFGAPTVLVAADPNLGFNNYYPSWSPDGEWIAFTRSSGSSYDDGSAQTWVVKADGSQPPVQLTTANLGASLTNSWARWVPFPQTFGAGNQKLFYLTFSTKREFGVRVPFVGRPQIWMTPFFPERAAMGMDPSGPTFRVPFQDVNTSNHIAQWTQAVVVQ